MFVGHALLAFALVAAVTARTEHRDRALVYGAVAGAFAAVPDVDIGYAFLGLFEADGGALARASAFWQAGNVVHRAVTHSVVIAPLVALSAALWVHGRREDAAVARAGAVCLLALLVGVAWVENGPLGAVVMGAFAVASLGLSEATVHATDVGPAATFVLGTFGVASHPFGDLWTGEPPQLFYPLDVTFLARHVTLHPDPTLHLLVAFGFELTTVWAALAVYSRLTERPIVAALDRRATLGVGYAASALVVPAPTLDLSYPFVFSVLAVGFVGAVPRVRALWARRLDLPDALSATMTGLAAVTLAWLAYTTAYLAGAVLPS